MDLLKKLRLRLVLGDKNGALQGESRAHTWSYVTADSPQQSPFLAPKPTRLSCSPQALDSKPALISHTLQYKPTIKLSRNRYARSITQA
ncbi:hypothetical protein [Helicobacter canis]|uniref:hypothetical protein n=1 Tax=Helicobacter canis TaxID=29419 RepID=UPI0003FC4911|nr:hypothetical protein [Helicobacter canis]